MNADRSKAMDVLLDILEVHIGHGVPLMKALEATFPGETIKPELVVMLKAYLDKKGVKYIM